MTYVIIVIIYFKFVYMTIEGMLNNVKSVDLPNAVPDIIMQTKADLILLNQLQLYNHGIDANGNLLTPYKSDSYAKKKFSRNPGPGFRQPDLKDTGEFYQDYTLVTSRVTFELDSSNVKSSALKKHYGDDIFGLTNDNKKVYALGVFYSGVQRYITLKTGLTFR